MATVAASATARKNNSCGGRTERLWVLTMGTYATGGETLTMQTLGMGVVEFVHCEPALNATPIIVTLKYDYTNQKMLAFAADGTQVANGTDLSGYTARIRVVGRG